MPNYYNPVHNNTTYTSPETVTVNENKAPTDESIRLAWEFMEKARKSVLEQETINNNKVSYTYIVTHEIVKNKRILLVRFKLNGEEHIVETYLEGRQNPGEAALHEVVQGLARHLATQISKELSRTLFK